MATVPLEERLVEIETRFSQRIADLDKRVAHLSAQVEGTSDQPKAAWWKRIVGVYANDPAFDEAERLGRELRDSQLPESEKESAL